MFDTTKKVLENYNNMTEENRQRYLRVAPIEEVEIIADYPDKILPPPRKEKPHDFLD